MPLCFDLFWAVHEYILILHFPIVKQNYRGSDLNADNFSVAMSLATKRLQQIQNYVLCFNFCNTSYSHI